MYKGLFQAMLSAIITKVIGSMDKGLFQAILSAIITSAFGSMVMGLFQAIFLQLLQWYFIQWTRPISGNVLYKSTRRTAGSTDTRVDASFQQQLAYILATYSLYAINK